MPLLIGCTIPTPIGKEEVENKDIYDPMSQKVVIDQRFFGTKCLKTFHMETGRGSNLKTDKKNQIDDTKYV